MDTFLGIILAILLLLGFFLFQTIPFWLPKILDWIFSTRSSVKYKTGFFKGSYFETTLLDANPELIKPNYKVIRKIIKEFEIKKNRIVKYNDITVYFSDFRSELERMQNEIGNDSPYGLFDKIVRRVNLKKISKYIERLDMVFKN